jgi:nitroreductase
MKSIDPLDLNQLIKERRSVKPKKFKPGSKVPDEVVEQALYNATWAPNHGNTEPWHFRVYKGDGLVKLNEFQSELYKKESGEKYTQAKYESLKTMHNTVSHNIAICYKKGPAVKIPELEEIQAVACAVQNLAFTISAYGYVGLGLQAVSLTIHQLKPILI